MPWCPVCKEEYKEGITTCPECNATLVASLEEAEKSDYQDLLTFTDEKLAKKFTEYLQYSKIDAKYHNEKEKGEFIISVLKKDVAKAKKHFAAFYSVESANALSRNQDGYHAAKEIPADETDDELSWDRSETASDEEVSKEDDSASDEETAKACSCSRATGSYVPMAEKVSDLFSTLVVFSIFGVIGLVALILELVGVTHFMNTMMMIMVVAIVCIGIPVVLITTYKSYKKTKALTADEEKLTASLTEWMESVFTKETIHRMLYSLRVNAPGLPEEQLYIMLNQAMKKRVCDQFGEIEESYLDYIVDNFYDAHFTEDFDSLEEEA